MCVLWSDQEYCRLSESITFLIKIFSLLSSTSNAFEFYWVLCVVMHRADLCVHCYWYSYSQVMQRIWHSVYVCANTLESHSCHFDADRDWKLKGQSRKIYVQQMYHMHFCAITGPEVHSALSLPSTQVVAVFGGARGSLNHPDEMLKVRKCIFILVLAPQNWSCLFLSAVSCGLESIEG